jgi:hypothetical protein
MMMDIPNLGQSRPLPGNNGIDPTFPAAAMAPGPPPPGLIDQLPEIQMMLTLPLPDLSGPMQITFPVRTLILTTALDTPDKAQGIAQFQQTLGHAVNQLMNDWAVRYQTYKQRLAQREPDDLSKVRFSVDTPCPDCGNPEMLMDPAAGVLYCASPQLGCAAREYTPKELAALTEAEQENPDGD